MMDRKHVFIETLTGVLLLLTAAVAVADEQKPPAAASSPSSQTRKSSPTNETGKFLDDIKAQQAVLESIKKRGEAERPHVTARGCGANAENCSRRDTALPGLEQPRDINDYKMEKADFDGGRQKFPDVQRVVESASKPSIVMPEAPTAVRVSDNDVNRITCSSGDIRDVVFSRDKGMTVSFAGKDAFLKFKHLKQGRKSYFSPEASEMFIVCGDATYNIIAVPDRIPAQTIRLSSGDGDRIKKNQSFFSGMSTEKKMLAMIRAVYTGEIPESFNVQTNRVPIEGIFKDITIYLNRTVVADGEGLQLKEFILGIRESSRVVRIELDEKDFLKLPLTKDTLAVSLDKMILNKGENVRLFICEMIKERNTAASEPAIRIDHDFKSTESATSPSKAASGQTDPVSSKGASADAKEMLKQQRKGKTK
ncbi:MAG: type-F conjugative transfer system secretin TraK [Syntrophales bacterium]